MLGEVTADELQEGGRVGDEGGGLRDWGLRVRGAGVEGAETLLGVWSEEEVLEYGW